MIMITTEIAWTAAGALISLLLIGYFLLRPDAEPQREGKKEQDIRAEEHSEEEEIQRILFEFWRARRDLRIMCEGDRELFFQAWPRMLEVLEKRYPEAVMQEVRFRLLNMDKEHFPARLFPHTKEQGGLYV